MRRSVPLFLTAVFASALAAAAAGAQSSQAAYDLLDRGKTKQAIKAFDRLLEDSDGSCGDCLLGLAASLNRAGRYEEAEQFARRLIEETESTGLRVAAYNQIGFSRFRRRPLPQPWTPEALANGGDDYRIALENLKEAETAFRNAVELDGARNAALQSNLNEMRGWLSMVGEHAGVPAAVESIPRPAPLSVARGSRTPKERDLAQEAQQIITEANALRAGGRIDEARPQYEAGIALFLQIGGRRSAGLSLESLGDGLRESGQLSEAIEIYRRALALSPDLPQSRTNLAAALSSTGKPEDAIREYRGLLEDHPDHAVAAINLGNLLLQSGKTEEAIQVYESAIQHHEDVESTAVPGGESDVVVLGRQEEILAAIYGNLGSAQLSVRRNEEALDSLRRACELHPSSPALRYNFGVVAQRLDRREEAAEAYQEAIALDPRHAPAHNNLANILRESGDLTTAIDTYQRALELNPKYATAAGNLSSAERARDGATPALSEARRAAELAPDSADAFDNLGYALLLSGAPQEAAAALRRALALGASDTGIYNNLGIALRETADLAGAIEAFRSAEQLEPEDVATLNNLAGALRKFGRFEDAAALYRRATELDPENPVLFNNLALVLRDQGRNEEGARAFARAITLWDG